MKFVRETLLRGTCQRFPIALVDINTDIAVFWHNEIQPSVRQASQAQYRPDARWNWPLLIRLLPRGEMLVGRQCLGYAVMAPSSTGAAIPVALSLLVEQYDLIQGEQPGTFLWFAASAPDDTFMKYGIPPLADLGRTLLDTTMVSSTLSGLNGRMSLHAAPGGDAYLAKYYGSTCQLISVPPDARLKGLRKNDGRYFHATETLAHKLLQAFDPRR